LLNRLELVPSSAPGLGSSLEGDLGEEMIMISLVDFAHTPLGVHEVVPSNQYLSTRSDFHLQHLREEQDIQCHNHTDGLNKAGFLEQTTKIRVFKCRSIHVYQVG
jgi:urease alpha subunit